MYSEAEADTEFANPLSPIPSPTERLLHFHYGALLLLLVIWGIGIF